jgi:hypothetical protein
MLLMQNVQNLDRDYFIAYLQELNSDQGGGGGGLAWVQGGVVHTMRNCKWDNSDAPSIVQSIRDISKQTEYPIMFHWRGPKGHSNLNHPHTSNQNVQISSIGTTQTWSSYDALMHNGDTPSEIYHRLFRLLESKLGEEQTKILREKFTGGDSSRNQYLIDTQVITYLVGILGPGFLKSMDAHVGSFIYTRMNDGIPEYYIKRDNVGLRFNDYTPLHLMRWNNGSSWMICSKPSHYITQTVRGMETVTEVPHGFHTLQNILNPPKPEASKPLPPKPPVAKKRNPPRKINGV